MSRMDSQACRDARRANGPNEHGHGAGRPCGMDGAAGCRVDQVDNEITPVAQELSCLRSSGMIHPDPVKSRER